jgi:hypothetical protein
MIQLRLDENERSVMMELLEHCISDLYGEISNTDNIEYKMMLKGRKAVLLKVLEALQFEASRPRA